jgi:uncharacterized membrane protein
MNAAHLHLMVNHLPLFATIFSGLLLAAGLLLKQKPLSQAGLALAIVAALGAFAALETGEGAEDMVEDLPGVVRGTIHDHQEAAEAALWSTIVLGAFALGALALPVRMAEAKRKATLGALALTLVAFVLIARANNLGGHIRHPEITSGNPSLPGGVADDDERERRP